ncbi:MAG: hypothetical protein IKZ88_06740 [Neisseriaceae bacterium]|nr:hypothetical protein [Neisseriaceae bacterium]
MSNYFVLPCGKTDYLQTDDHIGSSLQIDFRQPERIIEALSKFIRQAARLDIITAHYSLLTAH